jgi:hypothetical protein
MYRGLLWRAQSTDETFVALKDGRPWFRIEPLDVVAMAEFTDDRKHRKLIRMVSRMR